MGVHLWLNKQRSPEGYEPRMDENERGADGFASFAGFCEDLFTEGREEREGGFIWC